MTLPYRSIYDYERAGEISPAITQVMAGAGVQGMIDMKDSDAFNIEGVTYVRLGEVLGKGQLRQIMRDARKHYVREADTHEERQNAKSLKDMTKLTGATKRLFLFGFEVPVEDQPFEAEQVAGLVIFREPKDRIVGEELRELGAPVFTGLFLERGGDFVIFDPPSRHKEVLSSTLTTAQESLVAQT